LTWWDDVGHYADLHATDSMKAEGKREKGKADEISLYYIIAEVNRFHAISMPMSGKKKKHV